MKHCLNGGRLYFTVLFIGWIFLSASANDDDGQDYWAESLDHRSSGKVLRVVVGHVNITLIIIN
jgi:hypothetical protein